MKNNNQFGVFGIIALFFLGLFITAQGKSINRLCSTWLHPKYQIEISFFEDGTGSINGIDKFYWRSGKGYLEINPEANSNIHESISYAYTINNNGYELTLTNLDDVHKDGPITLIR